MFKSILGSVIFASVLFSATTTVDGRNTRRFLKKGKKSKKKKGNKKGSQRGDSSPAKPEVRSLSALITKAPGYEGGPIGTTVMRCNPSGSFLFHLSAMGLDPSCTGCKIAIMDGTSCSSNLSSSYYSTAMESDPWNAGGENYYTAFTEMGLSRSAFSFSNGYDCDDNLGKVVAVYDTNENMIACGKLGVQPDTTQMQAVMGSYPGYEGDLSPEGTVTVSVFPDNTFSFAFDVSGLRENVENGGIHIHGGLSCNSHEEVLGHEWNTNFVRDLWTATGGAVYSTDDTGTANGMFYLYNGFNLEENFHHAIVIHDFDGKRVGCGVLQFA